MVQSSRSAVNLYCDFDGVICPIRASDQSKEAPDESYTIDRHGPYNISWSSELARQLNYLITKRYIRWHWLTSNQYITDCLDEMMGFDPGQTIVEELFAPNRRGYITTVPGGKAGIIRRAIINSHRASGQRSIVWIDDDYSVADASVRKLDELARQLAVPVLLITPSANTGLNKRHMCQLLHYIECPSKPAGLQYAT